MKVNIIEYVEKTAVIESQVDGFGDLSLNDKMISYYLWYAGAVGDDIFYDQRYKFGLKIRDFFMDLLFFKEHIPQELYYKLEIYTKNILINHGIHDSSSTKKFVPTFSKDELLNIYNAVLPLGFNHILTADLQRAIFDSNFEVMSTQKSPSFGKDMLTESCNTFYQYVTTKDLENFEQKNPLNSNVVKENGQLVEHVWRAGNLKVPKGVYAKYLKNVIYHINKAMEFMSEDQKKSFKFLRDYFEQGDAKLFDDYNIQWLHTNPTVDTILGFIESYGDAIGFKGSYESMIFFKDKNMNNVIKTIADKSQHFEDHSPWDIKYKKTWTTIPVANAVMQISAFGQAGPTCFAGVNLPNEQWIREKYGSKNIFISNITFLSRNAFVKKMLDEFVEDKEIIKMYESSMEIRAPLLVTLHEVVGHGSGKISPSLKLDPKDYLREYYSSLEEARAELCSLHHIWNPVLKELGLVNDDSCAKAAYHGYVTQYLTLMRRYEFENEIHEDHERATSLIVQYCIDKGSAGFYTKNNKTYPKINNYELMRTHIAELLSEVMRIKAEGDYTAGKNLIEKYGIHFDKHLRDEIVSRSKAINYPSKNAYVMPRPELVKDSNGKIINVVLKPYSGILEQGYKLRELNNSNF